MPSRLASFGLGLTALLLYAALLWLFRESTGFLAVSDDDYARVVIAQEWVTDPSWDPSGTSWLPLPLLLRGITFSLLEPSLGVARGLSFGLALASCAALYASLRSIALSPVWSASASLVSLSFPTALPFGWATVPELWTAALVAIGGVSLLARPGCRLQWWGGIAVLAATACRYEAWPAACVLSLHHGWTAIRTTARPATGGLETGTRQATMPAIERLREFIPAWLQSCALSLLPISFIAAWMVHGILHHGAPLFFLQRVSDYKAALGDAAPSAWQLLWGYPKAFLSSEAEIAMSALAAVIALLWLGSRSAESSRAPALGVQASAGARAGRLGWLVGAQLAFLMVGALRGGVPTHHAERTLLAPWMLCVIFCALVVSSAGSPLRRGPRLGGFLLAGAALLSGVTIRSSNSSPPDDWSLRKEHERLGEQIRRELDDEEPVALALLDYGYFAVMAAATQPERFDILDRHDPREPNAGTQLSHWARETSQCYFVTSSQLGAAPPSRLLGRAGELEFRRLARCAKAP